MAVTGQNAPLHAMLTGMQSRRAHLVARGKLLVRGQIERDGFALWRQHRQLGQSGCLFEFDRNNGGCGDC